jgi:amino acid adenylation domain-containing protein
MEHIWAGSSSNLAWLLWDTADRCGGSPALEVGDVRTDYATLVGRASALGAALIEAGVEPGDRVAVFLERGADAVAAFFGAAAVGAIVINVNESLRPRQIEHILGHSGASVLLASQELLGQQPRPIESPGAAVLLIDGFPATDGLFPVDRVAGDPAQIIYTSGSTGRPKGVTMSHGALWSSVGTIVGYLGIRPDDRIGTVMPLSFTYGFNQLLCAVATGGTLVIEGSSLAHTIVTNLHKRSITVLAGVPGIWLQLLGVPLFREEPVESLRLLTNAGGHLPPPTARALREAQPQAQLYLMYGMTEVIRSTYLAPDEFEKHPGSMGRPMPGTEIMVLRDDLSPCEVGEVGELVHRGPTVALGYWNDPEGTERTFRPNPLLPRAAPQHERVVFSGDLVRRDEDGFLYFVSRKDRLIKTLGYRVSPDEVTDVLHASGEIEDAIVLAEPDDQRGQRIVAHVVLKETGSLERLRRFCQVELPRYMQPARYEIRESLPRSASGKHDVLALMNGAAVKAQ